MGLDQNVEQECCLLHPQWLLGCVGGACVPDYHQQEIYILLAVLLQQFCYPFFWHVVVWFYYAFVRIAQQLQTYFPVINVLNRIPYKCLEVLYLYSKQLTAARQEELSFATLHNISEHAQSLQREPFSLSLTYISQNL